MTKFLLDANMSPKTGRFLSNILGLDVETLHGLRLGSLSDPEVARRGMRTGRVVITLDSDFESASTGLFEASQGVIYLDLPNEFRLVQEINRILSDFFTQQAPGHPFRGLTNRNYTERSRYYSNHPSA